LNCGLDFRIGKQPPRLISPHLRHNLPFLSPRNILERILNLIHPHREKSTYTLLPTVRGAVSYTSFTDIIILSKSSIRQLFTVVFSFGLLAPTFLWHRLSNGLAALHLSCLSYNPVYFGHGHLHRTHSRLAPDLLHLGHHSVATFIPRSLAVHSIYFFSPLNVSLPRLHHHHALATSHRHFLLSRLPDSTRACIKGNTRRTLSTT